MNFSRDLEDQIQIAMHLGHSIGDSHVGFHIISLHRLADLPSAYEGYINCSIQCV